MEYRAGIAVREYEGQVRRDLQILDVRYEAGNEGYCFYALSDI